jgi:hypothetical protein
MKRFEKRITAMRIEGASKNRSCMKHRRKSLSFCRVTTRDSSTCHHKSEGSRIKARKVPTESETLSPRFTLSAIVPECVNTSNKLSTEAYGIDTPHTRYARRVQ